ncbi:MAG: F0F1 ATP synthase subunit gamma [Alphaproteobacteria bacterium]|nr:F0F1 ATP synthase subunit gamma [Alphaproteobacteria bacterium]
MQTLESLARRTTTLRRIRGVVRTMKMLSVVNAVPFDRAAMSIDAFHETVLAGFQVVLAGIDIAQLSAPRPDASGVVLVFGSDHGLCGGFNEEAAKFTAMQLANRQAPARAIAIGARLAAALEATGVEPVETFSPPASMEGVGPLAAALLIALDRERDSGGAIVVEVVHNQRAEAGTYRSVMSRLLPIDKRWLQELKRRPWRSTTLPTYSMDTESLFAALVRQYLFASLFEATAESMAAENAARLALMQQAEHALDDRLEELMGDERRVRQSQVTDELLDVIAGFEALSGRATSGSSRDKY